MPRVAQFARHRNLLFTVAYEITASVGDAEDVVQETYLRWAQAAEQPGGIRQPRAYLLQIATRQALNPLRSRARQRETGDSARCSSWTALWRPWEARGSR